MLLTSISSFSRISLASLSSINLAFSSKFYTMCVMTAKKSFVAVKNFSFSCVALFLVSIVLRKITEVELIQLKHPLFLET